jgi:hypothetical protein
MRSNQNAVVASSGLTPTRVHVDDGLLDVALLLLIHEDVRKGDARGSDEAQHLHRGLVRDEKELVAVEIRRCPKRCL